MSTYALQDTSWGVVAAFLKDREDSIFYLLELTVRRGKRKLNSFRILS